MKKVIFIFTIFLNFESYSFSLENESQVNLSPKDPHKIQDRESARGDIERANEMLILFGYPTLKNSLNQDSLKGEENQEEEVVEE